MQLQSQVEKEIHDFIKNSMDFVYLKDIEHHFEGQFSSDTVFTTLALLEYKELILRHDDGVYNLNPDMTGIELVLLG